jgi:5'-nucleotidase
MKAVGILAVLLLLFFTAPEAVAFYTLQIIHQNDTHSNLAPVPLALSLADPDTAVRIPAGGAALAAGLISRAREASANVVFLHAGDLVQGTLFYTVYRGRADAGVYNVLSPDVMTPGNHEFDRGSPGLALLLDEVRFPVVCANLDVREDSLLAGRIPPFTVLEVGGELVGVAGLITEELPEVSSPSGATVVLPLEETARAVVEEMTALGVDKVILLTHVGYAADLELAARVPGVDVIVGGHSHTLLGDFADIGLQPEGDYPTAVQGPDGNTVLVVTAWRYGAVLGSLTVEFDSAGTVTGWTGNPVIPTSAQIPGVRGLAVVEPEPVVAEMVALYTDALEDFQGECLATAESDLLHVRVPGGGLPGGSEIAPVVCDAMLWKVNTLGTGADIALQNAGGVRIDVPAGDVTVGTVYTLLPFGNTLAVLDLTGGEIRDLLEGALEAIFDRGLSDGTFPYVAGMRFSAVRNAPAGARVTSLEASDGNGGYAPMDPDRVYRVVTNTFVAGGGDGFGMLRGRPFTDTGFVDAEVFADYARMLGTVVPGEQRVFLED